MVGAISVTIERMYSLCKQIFMKLFKTSNIRIVNWCQTLFGCELPSTLFKWRFQKFTMRCIVVLNLILFFYAFS